MDLNALICDHAQVAGGKLFISGANINSFNFAAGGPAPYVIAFALAGTVHVPWTATNQDHALDFRILTEDGKPPALAGDEELPAEGLGGEMHFNVGRPPGLPGGEEQLIPFAFQLTGVPFLNAGRHIIIIKLDGSEMTRLPFRIMLHPVQSQFGPATPGRM